MTTDNSMPLQPQELGQERLQPNRRQFLAGLGGASSMLLAGCVTTTTDPSVVSLSELEKQAKLMYAPLPDEKFPLPAVNLSKIDSKYYRRQVRYDTRERVGSLIVDTKNYYLYLVQEDGMAMRYGVGLGRAGFEWSGRARVAWKRPWPTWTPPAEMIKRQPELEQWSAANGGMPPGLDNPLGARALYIFEGNVDTLYRIHGTAEDWSIGRAVSSGCVRMLNQDVIDLYNRVANNSPIIVT